MSKIKKEVRIVIKNKVMMKKYNKRKNILILKMKMKTRKKRKMKIEWKKRMNKAKKKKMTKGKII